MASLRKRPYTDPATGEKKKTASYYGKYRNALGKTVEVPLSPNRAAAQQMLADLVRAVEREKAGLIDHYTEHRSIPLGKHLDVNRDRRTPDRCHLGVKAHQIADRYRLLEGE